MAVWLIELLQAMSSQMLLLVVAAGAAALLIRPVQRAASILSYFLAINLASVAGVAKGSFGWVSGTWRPPRQDVQPSRRAGDEASWLLTLIASSIVVTVVALWLPPSVVAIAFWTSLLVLAFIYGIYPLMLAGVALLVRRSVVKAAIEPSVALLVVANDEDAVIDAKLLNALAADYPRDRFRIIVASDGSVDRTNEIVRSYARDGVELLAFEDRRGKMAAINAAIETLEGVDVVVLSDANVFLQPAAVRHLVGNLADPGVGAVSGDVILVGDRAALGWSEDLYYRYERWLQKTESGIGSMVGVDGALYAIRKSLFVPQPPDTILDDMAIPMAVLKQGYRVVFEPAAIGVEQGSQSAWEEFLRKSRVLAGAAQFLKRASKQLPWRQPQVLISFFSHKTLRWLSPALAITTLASAVALAGTSEVYLVAAVVQVGLLGLGIAGCVPGLRRNSAIGFAHYYCLVQAAAAVGFVRGLRGRQPATWQRFARASADPHVAAAESGELV
jgi:GT2 family glycosyltransferase